MNLRNRSLLILGTTFFIFFIIIAAVSLSVTLSGLDRIERQDMGDSMRQVQSAISAESASLLTTTQDWAWWDDMDQYAVNHNPAFVESNADLISLATLKANLFVILDDNGNLLYGQVLSPDFTANRSVSGDQLMLIRSNPGLVTHTADDPGMSGILVLPEGPMIVSSVPIMKSDRTGAVHGTIIIGRYLEPGPLHRIDDMTGYHLSFGWQGREDSGTTVAVNQGSPGQMTLVVVPENETAVSGYATVRDLTGKDLVLKVTKQRELFRTGYANIVTYLSLLALWAIMTGIIVVIVMDRTVLRRMGMLTEHVRTLSDKPGEVPAPVLSGNDELAKLEKTILASRKNLLIREQQMRVFINAISSPAALFSLEGKILLANPAFAEYLQRRPDEVAGTNVRSCLPKDEIQKYDRYVQEAIRTKEIVHFENETGGKTFLMSYYPVLDNDGSVIQLGFLTFDISERKRLENALQKMTRKIALLNTVIFTDIQNKVFVQMGYLELARHASTDTRIISYLEKEETVVKEIQSSLSFARQFNDMGMNPPRWQNVNDVILYAISHLDLGSISRDFRLEGIEIYADSLLERVFVTLVENTIMYAAGSPVIRAGYSIQGNDAVIVVEDDGPGIPEDKKEEIFSKGIGAGGSTSLFLSREILSTTGITIRENGVAGKGARFEIRVPKGSYRLSGRTSH
jgi:PAS domain S-box-containing protein